MRGHQATSDLGVSRGPGADPLRYQGVTSGRTGPARLSRGALCWSTGPLLSLPQCCSRCPLGPKEDRQTQVPFPGLSQGQSPPHASLH